MLDLTLLHNRSINVRAYSYRAGQMDRVHKMMTAMLQPDSCEASSKWENKMDDGGE